MNWLGVSMAVIKAVMGVEAVLKEKGKSKQDKASEIADIAILGTNEALNKELLSMPTVQRAKLALIDATVAFENAVREAKANLAKTTPVQ